MPQRWNVRVDANNGVEKIRGSLTVQRKVSSSDQGAWIDNSCQEKGLDSWQEHEHGCQSDSQDGAGVAAVFG